MIIDQEQRSRKQGEMKERRNEIDGQSEFFPSLQGMENQRSSIKVKYSKARMRKWPCFSKAPLHYMKFAVT